MRKLSNASVLAAVMMLAGACSSGGGAHELSTARSTSAASTSSIAVVASRPPAPCPAHLPSSVDNSAAPGLDAKMVPIAATGARVCRYAPLNAKHASALVQSGVVAGVAAVQQLERQTNALHQIPNAERIPCPLNPAAPGWALEFGDGASAIKLVVSPSDCGFVTNGVVSAGPSAAWLGALATITKPH